MNYLSVCSGIEAATCAWHPLGWKATAFSEIEAFPSAVLAHHYPTTPNWGDMTKFKEWPDADVNVLVGGTPCQSFSVAGLRKGLDDPRGNLMLTYLAIAGRYRPTWVVWENVPGVLSSNGGRDFAAFLRGLAELGYGFAYRILDAQYLGVAQRRRRVFVVGCLGNWQRAAAVLFERHSLQGHPAPSRKARQRIAPSLDGSAGRSGEFHTSGGLIDGPAHTLRAQAQASLRADNETYIPAPHAAISLALKSRDSKGVSSDGDGDGAILVPMVAGPLQHNGKAAGSTTQQDAESGMLVTHPLKGEGYDGSGRGTPIVPVSHVETMPTLRVGAPGDGPGHGARSGDCKDEYIVPVSFGWQNSSQQGASASASASHTPTLDKSKVPAVMTLAIRGRGESHDLETREDGTANAILTPNGGRAGIGVGAVAIGENVRGEIRETEVSTALAGGGGKPGQGYAATRIGMQVRRLTPRECERLQGFKDDYTLIIARGKPSADGPRYKALGNSMAVPVMAWIGMRIQMVESLDET